MVEKENPEVQLMQCQNADCKYCKELEKLDKGIGAESLVAGTLTTGPMTKAGWLTVEPMQFKVWGGVVLSPKESFVPVGKNTLEFLSESPSEPEPESLAEKVKAAVAKTVPTTPAQQKQWEVLAQKLEDISVKHGVRAMSHVAALAIAKEFSKLFKVKTLGDVASEAADSADYAAEKMQAFNQLYAPPPQPVQANQENTLHLVSLQTVHVQDASLGGTCRRVMINISKLNWGQSPAELRQIALDALTEKVNSLLPGWVLVSEPHVMSQTVTGNLKVAGWAMQRAPYAKVKGQQKALGGWDSVWEWEVHGQTPKLGWLDEAITFEPKDPPAF